MQAYSSLNASASTQLTACPLSLRTGSLVRQVNKESLCLPSLFTDYDHFNVGDITEAGMERALGGACLLPPEPIFRAIVKKFREHSRRSSGGEVNYRAFLAAVSVSPVKYNLIAISLGLLLIILLSAFQRTYAPPSTCFQVLHGKKRCSISSCTATQRV